MLQGILEFLRSADRTIAWSAAVLLAAGGTAVVVVLYLQWQRLRARLSRPQRRTKAARPRPAASTPTRVRRPDPAGLAVYRREDAAPATAGTTPAVVHVPVNPPVAPGAPAPELDSLLARLREAAARLEDLTRRRGGGAPVIDDPDSGSMLDMEFLHRQGGAF